MNIKMNIEIILDKNPGQNKELIHFLTKVNNNVNPELVNKLKEVRQNRSEEENDKYYEIFRCSSYNADLQKKEIAPKPPARWYVKSIGGYYEDRLPKIEKKQDYCLWYIGCKLNNNYYGGMIVYVYPSYAFAEYITKYKLPLLTHEAYPEIKFPSLNSILIPEIEKELRLVGVKQIFVAPILKQKEILINNYQFKIYEGELPKREEEKLLGTLSDIWLVREL